MTAMASQGTVPRWMLEGSLLLVLLACVVGTLAVLERQRPQAVRAAELSYLPRGDYLKVAVLGYRQLAADLIWLQAVQHFGKRTQSAEGYRWAYHAVDVLTDLDPKFSFAYQAAGAILGVVAEQVDESVAILKKGIAHNPTVWELPFFLGYNYYYELHDSAEAAKYFRAASALPGSPWYLPALAARMTVEAGDLFLDIPALGEQGEPARDVPDSLRRLLGPWSEAVRVRLGDGVDDVVI
jgi:tetratricopeptide (TPR) repeat protein